MKTGFPSRDSEEEPQNIIEIRPYKKTEEQDHTGHLGILHKLVTRFAAGYHLVPDGRSAEVRRNREIPSSLSPSPAHGYELLPSLSLTK